MLFIVTGTDFPNSLDKRMATRDAHIAHIESMKAAGKIAFGAARLNDAGQMKGSVLVCVCDSRQELDEWLDKEPYIKNGVWESVSIEECKLAPTFAARFPDVA